MFDLPFRGLKSEEKELCFLHFSGKNDELAKRACCAKRVHQYSLNCVFSKELAKRSYHAKRVHLLRMNTHPLAELPEAKRG